MLQVKNLAIRISLFLHLGFAALTPTSSKSAAYAEEGKIEQLLSKYSLGGAAKKNLGFSDTLARVTVGGNHG